ncbi:unnamed protein product [Calypogeia fissa]
MVSSALGHHGLCMLWTVKKKKSANAIILGGKNLVMQFVPIISVPEDPCESAGVKSKIWAKYVQSFEDNCLHHPTPHAPEETLLIVLFKYVLPSKGFHAWDSLASDRDYVILTGFPSQCYSGNVVVSWALKAKIDAIWIDTSDEELSCPPENSNDEALITKWADFCPTLDLALEHFKEKVDKQHRMTAMQANVIPLHGDGKDDGVQCLSVDTDHPCLNQPNDVDVVNTLDDLADTQVLYGHGSYAGLTFSQFTETPPPPPYGL